MFVVILTYQKSLDVIDALLEAHIRFLDDQYSRGVFLASGPRVPRTGGVILANNLTRQALEILLAEDPFSREGAASYEIIECTMGMAAPGLDGLLG